MKNKELEKHTSQLLADHHSITKKSNPVSLEIPLPCGFLKLYFDYFDYFSNNSELGKKGAETKSSRVLSPKPYNIHEILEPLDESCIEFSAADEDESKHIRFSSSRCFEDEQNKREKYLNFFDSSVIF